MTRPRAPPEGAAGPASRLADETSPLLSSVSSLTEAGSALGASESATCLASEYVAHDSVALGVVARQETSLMLLSSVPLALSSLLQSSFHFINILSLGHLGTNELAAATLANMTIFMLVNAPAVGLASALTTFCATAFTA
ncbi:hypothetical protein LPJ60_005912, partial [Coemansia sp. RSA 2675]